MPARLLSITLLSTTCLTAPVWADITSEDVWASWEETLMGYGPDATSVGSVTPTADGLRVTDIAIFGETPEATFEGSIAEINFIDLDDGTVLIEMSDTIPLSVTVTEEGEEMTIPIIFSTTTLDMFASGDPGAINTTYSATEMAMTLGDIGDLPETVDLSFAIRMVGVTGETLWDSESDTVRSSSGTVGANSILADISVNEAQEGNFTMSLVANNLAIASTGTVPVGVSFFDPALMSHPDYEGSFISSIGGTNFDATFRDSESDGAVQFSSSGGLTEVDFGNDSLSYVGGANDIELNVQASDLPVPVAVSMASYGYDMLMPMAATDDARDFRVGLSLVDLAVDDFLWNLFDPGSVLPRDPATIALTLAGTGRWFFDLMDPEQADAFEDAEIPGEVESLALEDLNLSVAGANLTGSGAFTFDNSDLITFDGLPAPDGSVDLRLEGGNGLLDKLVQMGLLPQEQAMGARMMMGLFMTPGEGADVLTSTIAVQPDGQVLANGQRIR